MMTLARNGEGGGHWKEKEMGRVGTEESTVIIVHKQFSVVQETYSNSWTAKAGRGQDMLAFSGYHLCFSIILCVFLTSYPSEGNTLSEVFHTYKVSADLFEKNLDLSVENVPSTGLCAIMFSRNLDGSLVNSFQYFKDTQSCDMGAVSGPVQEQTPGGITIMATGTSGKRKEKEIFGYRVGW